MSLLAISADGGAVALADQVGEVSGSLTLAESTGPRCGIPLPGCWRHPSPPMARGWPSSTAVARCGESRPRSGRTELLADGPFIGSPIIDGRRIAPDARGPVGRGALRVASRPARACHGVPPDCRTGSWSMRPSRSTTATWPSWRTSRGTVVHRLTRRAKSSWWTLAWAPSMSPWPATAASHSSEAAKS